jgi:hypothetical protein
MAQKGKVQARHKLVGQLVPFCLALTKATKQRPGIVLHIIASEWIVPTRYTLVGQLVPLIATVVKQQSASYTIGSK